MDPYNYSSDTIVLFHTYFPQRWAVQKSISVHKLDQPTAGRITIFHKYYCYTKPGDIVTNLTLWNSSRYIIGMSKYHNAGMWSTLRKNENLLEKWSNIAVKYNPYFCLHMESSTLATQEETQHIIVLAFRNPILLQPKKACSAYYYFMI